MGDRYHDDVNRRFRRGGAGRFAVVLAIVGLPPIGAWMAGRDLDDLFQFPPPLKIPTDYTRFSFLAAGSVIGLLIFLVTAWVLGARRGPASPTVNPGTRFARVPSRFPWWGWAATGWTLAWWLLTWTRWSWFTDLQSYTFFPLWLGFVVTVNALTQWRTGTCLMRRVPSRWLLLFAASAGFWWGFEWLNRFVRNWHYLGVEAFRPWNYAFHASLCFSTVLPAVSAVAEWLESHPGWRQRTATGPLWSWAATPGFASSLIVFGGLALLLTGAFPNSCYPALWVAPLSLFLGRSILRGGQGVAHDVSRGRWNRALTWMAAGLICGGFWELWNVHSLVKWIYTVPGVERWHVFEMPLLGYTGYLPFGLECLLIVEWLVPDTSRQ